MNKLQVLLVIFVFSSMSLELLSNCVFATNLTNQAVTTCTSSQNFTQQTVQKSKKIKNQSKQRFNQVEQMLTDDESRWIYKSNDNKPSAKSFVINDEKQINESSSGISQPVYVEDKSQYTSKPINANVSTNEYVSSVPRPEWFEFCPIEYENPKHYKIPFTAKQFDSNDWYNFKQGFESMLAICDSKTGKYKDLCYIKLRQKWTYKISNFVPAKIRWAQYSANYQKRQMQNRIIDAMTSPVNVNVDFNGRLYHHFR